MRIAFLTWRDSTHPDGGGSEVFVEEIAGELVGRGHEVTIFCARHPGSAAESDLHGVRLLRRGGRLTVYLRGLVWVATRGRRLDVVVDVINGLPFATPLVRRRGIVTLIHHVHQRQWQIIYPGIWGRIGWFVERRATPRLYRHRPFVTVSNSSRDDLVAMGLPPEVITVVRNGVSSSPTGTPSCPTPRLCVLSRLVPHKQIEDALDAVAALRPRIPDLHLDILGGGWWRQRLVEHAELLGISDAVTFHGHVDDERKHQVLQRCWAHILPSRKEGWALAVIEAAQHGVPTIGYRSSGGLTDSIVDGVTGLLVDDRDGLVDGLERLLSDHVLREQLGAKAQVRTGEFSWRQSADAMRTVMESVHRRRHISGVV